MPQAAIDPLFRARTQAEADAGKKRHRFTERSWRVNGDGAHQGSCSTPGCHAEIDLKMVASTRQIRRAGSAFSSDCPTKK